VVVVDFAGANATAAPTPTMIITTTTITMVITREIAFLNFIAGAFCELIFKISEWRDSFRESNGH